VKFASEELTEDDTGLRIGGSDQSYLVVKPSPHVENDAVVHPPEWERARALGVMVEVGNAAVDAPMTSWIETIVRSGANYAHGIKLNSTGNFKTTLRIARHVQGFRFQHLGRLIITGLRNEFPRIGPLRVSFTIDDAVDNAFTDVQAYIQRRTAQIHDATDDSVDHFYGCTRCRSFALAHACTSTPERPPQCGSRPWYRVKAYALLAPDSVYNPCQVIDKGTCLDPERGEYEGVNTSTVERTGGRVSRVFLHSIFQHPHTACSCFQNIAFHIPDVDGIALMHRGYPGVTPDGSTWTTWANRIAGRQYHEGAASFSVNYMTSKKFLKGDGGWERVVWMTRTLKNAAGDAIPAHLRERIATEHDVTSLAELKEYLT
jgi:acetyl-CoA decarbonylase/synthase complex subunit beta